MSETLHSAIQAAAGPRTSPEFARAHAVASALELISAKLSSGASVDLEGEIDRLSNYADKIQEALKSK
ncbi:hypothetical protein [Pseudomonas gingeri]